jgi:hypothetical protein
MSAQVTVAVQMPVDAETEELLSDAEAAYRRAQKSEPGERVEIAGFESLCATLEASALAALLRGRGIQVGEFPPSSSVADVFARNAGGVTVWLTLPLEFGEQSNNALGQAAPAPAAAIEVRDDIRGRGLVLERFRSQLEAAIADPGKDRSSALSPSGVHNRVLTEILREYVARQDRVPVAVPVVYRDGSRASADFPFRVLNLAAGVSQDADALADGVLILRLALLSIRHTEMDAVVDGAWLRNADVSRPRPAAQTDDYVYHSSVRQLDELTSNGRQRVRLYIFQTGLETAVVGFFRAVVEFLGKHPGVLEVIPMFFAKNSRKAVGDGGGFAGYERGDVWATADGSR